MLHLIPAPLHRAGLRLAHNLRKRWWRVAKPRLSGVNLVLLDDAGGVLLVRHSYEAERWTLPGGGLGRGEDPEACARREVAEELGCAVAGLHPLGINQRALHGAPCTTHVFAGRAEGPLRPDGRELAEVRYFAPDRLPAERTAMVDACLAMLGR